MSAETNYCGAVLSNRANLFPLVKLVGHTLIVLVVQRAGDMRVWFYRVFLSPTVESEACMVRTGVQTLPAF